MEIQCVYCEVELIFVLFKWASGQSWWSHSLRLLACWNCGFRSC